MPVEQLIPADHVQVRMIVNSRVDNRHIDIHCTLTIAGAGFAQVTIDAKNSSGDDLRRWSTPALAAPTWRYSARRLVDAHVSVCNDRNHAWIAAQGIEAALRHKSGKTMQCMAVNMPNAKAMSKRHFIGHSSCVLVRSQLDDVVIQNYSIISRRR